MTYTDLMVLETFGDRFEYLKIGGVPAEHTFGHLREINQKFYRSREWQQVRELVIARDYGYDLGVPGYPIFGKVLVHHMNPLTLKDFRYYPERALDPEFLITVSHETHNGIHFGFEKPEYPSGERFVGDTKLW